MSAREAHAETEECWGLPCLTPQRSGSLATGQPARTPYVTAAIASQVISCAICVRPWPDSGPPRAFPPLVQEGRLPSLLVHHASLPIPPLWVTQRRLSSGQHPVSCLSIGQTDIADPQRLAADIPCCLDAERRLPVASLKKGTATFRRHLKASRRTLNNSKYNLSSYSIVSDQRPDDSQVIAR